MRAIPYINTYLKQLDEIIPKKLLLALMKSIVSDDKKNLYSLPIRDGGLKNSILVGCAAIHYESSKVITASLVEIMLNQGHVLPDKTIVIETKSKIARQNKSALRQKSKNIDKKLPERMGGVITEARGKVYLAGFRYYH